MIFNRKTIGLNIFFSLFQIVITGLVYYFLYKFLLSSLGTDLMGVWAIVLSISSTANIANLGIGSGVTRYTALFKTNGELAQIDKLIHTSVILLGFFFLSVIFIIYLVAPMWLNLVIEKNYYDQALAIVPYSLFCLLLNALSGIYAAGLDGLQKNYLRSLVFITSFILLILFTYYLVPKFGLLGVAYAQLIQAIFLLAAMIASLKFVLKDHKIFAFKWDKAVFKKIFSFGIREQIISVCQLCFDPLTKSLLGSFGSLSLVTYYEMANRLVLQLRGLLVNANQVLIPIFTSAQEKSAETGKNLYRQVFSINFLMCILWLSFIVSAVIPISILWIGVVMPAFVNITLLLSVAYFFNIVISPAYFSNMGSAKLRGNVIGNIIIAVLNVSLCYLLGYYFDGYGVVIGWSIALSAGSLFIVIAFHKENSIHFNTVILRHDIIIVLVSILYALCCYFLFIYRNDFNVWLMLAIVLGLLTVVCMVVYKVHPIGKKIVSNIRRKIKI
jgi:O-antigen/teichoic acid export membrane protein